MDDGIIYGLLNDSLAKGEKKFFCFREPIDSSYGGLHYPCTQTTFSLYGSRTFGGILDFFIFEFGFGKSERTFGKRSLAEG